MPHSAESLAVPNSAERVWFYPLLQKLPQFSYYNGELFRDTTRQVETNDVAHIDYYKPVQANDSYYRLKIIAAALATMQCCLSERSVGERQYEQTAGRHQPKFNELFAVIGKACDDLKLAKTKAKASIAGNISEATSHIENCQRLFELEKIIKSCLNKFEFEIKPTIQEKNYQQLVKQRYRNVHESPA
ncbi:MAG TPA: hypothetical protein DCZ48_10300, partial [Methylococcaceae bacterium]|nr:hypothetical protein [Methylococcaceae bacterium]